MASLLSCEMFIMTKHKQSQAISSVNVWNPKYWVNSQSKVAFSHDPCSFYTSFVTLTTPWLRNKLCFLNLFLHLSRGTTIACRFVLLI